jgi:hypothetical protein
LPEMPKGTILGLATARIPENVGLGRRIGSNEADKA